MKLDVTKLKELEGENKTEAEVKLKGRFSELINSEMIAVYKKSQANPSETEDVSVSGTLGHIMREYGLAGPGQSNPRFALHTSVETELESEEPEEAEDLPWDELEEIKGVGEKTKEKIKDILLNQ